MRSSVSTDGLEAIRRRANLILGLPVLLFRQGFQICPMGLRPLVNEILVEEHDHERCDNEKSASRRQAPLQSANRPSLSLSLLFERSYLRDKRDRLLMLFQAYFDGMESRLISARSSFFSASRWR